MSDEQELAARIGQELEPVVRDFAATVAASPSQEVGEWLADLVRSRRYRSQLKILAKAREATLNAGLPLHAVPMKTLAPLLEAGGLEDEDDDDMIGRWANLLANAATHSVDEVPPSFPEVLRQLDPLDALALDALYEQFGREPVGIVREGAGAKDEHRAWTSGQSQLAHTRSCAAVDGDEAASVAPASGGVSAESPRVCGRLLRRRPTAWGVGSESQLPHDGQPRRSAERCWRRGGVR